MTRSGVFLTNFKVFGNVVDHGLVCYVIVGFENVVYSENKAGNTVKPDKDGGKNCLFIRLPSLMYNTKYGKQVS